MLTLVAPKVLAVLLAATFPVAFAGAAEPPDPSSPDGVDGDLGAIDDGPDMTPDTRPDAPGPSPMRDEGVEYVDDEAESDEPEAEPDDSESDAEDLQPLRPPRVDGPYFGGLLFGAASFASVLNHDTPAPLVGAGGFVQAGDAVLRWLSIGIAVGAHAGFVGRQRLVAGALLVELAFIPLQRYPLSIRTAFGFGGGGVREQGIEGRSGFGGALFKGSLRYEFFPLAGKRRPDRGGGWAIGPELGWLGATPAAAGQPFVNTILLGVSSSFYWGS